MKNIAFSAILASFFLTSLAAQPLRSFPLSAVSLQESPFYEAQQTDLQYILALNPDRLLAPFLIDAGIKPKAERYGNWENTGLDGHIGGHYVSALALMYAATKNEEVLQRLNYMIDQLAECQAKNGNGYVGGVPNGQPMWEEVRVGKINAGGFSLNGKWVPLYNIHKLFAGLLDAYTVAGNEKSLDVLIKLSDWFLNMTANLSDEQLQDMLRSEHGGLNEVFADVAAITGADKYLTLAKRLSHKAILNPLLAQKDSLTGLHANTQIPKVIGYERIAQLTNDTAWSNAANFFWESVVHNRSVSIGGNSVREHFHPTDDFTSMIESNQGPETCNTYNMLRLSKLLFLSNPDAKYMDYYERALYNHILSSQHPDGGFVYFTPMRPRHYRVYSQPQEGFWCCVGSGLENHGKYGELIYAHDEHDLYVNLFVASTLDWQEKGITLQQTTKFPYEETSTLQFTIQQPQQFRLYIRYPGWVNEGEMQISVNGAIQKIEAASSSYVSIDRTWKTGDIVTVRLPMHTKLEYLPDGSSWASFVHGPIVLAAATETSNLKGIKADDSRMGHVAEGTFLPIETAPMIVKQQDKIIEHLKAVKNEPLTFTASELIYPADYKNVKLAPFYTIHDARYMLYWQVTTPERLEQIKQRLREQEKEMLALEARTVDYVAAGEQQPETEHGFKGEGTETGSTNGQPWRMASGWFSYDISNKNGDGKLIRVTYAGNGRNRKFDILLNDTLLKTADFSEKQDNESFFIDYEIPANLLNEPKLTVKFSAHEASSTGRIFQVRLLKAK